MISRILTAVARKLSDTPLVSRILEGVDLRSDNRMGERGALASAFEFCKINGVRGDYFEFGLWRGKTFIYAHSMKCRYRCNEMKMWGFDSFAGLPQIDDDRSNVWQPGQFSCLETELRQILRRSGLRESEFELVPGYYEQSLNQDLHVRLAGRQAAIVYIDCDLYISTKPVLDFIKRYIVNGSIVCFDDFFNYKGNPEQGEQRALSEFLSANEDLKFVPWFAYNPLGKAFIVRVADS